MVDSHRYVVTLVIDTVAVRGIKNFNFTKTAAGVITSCVSSNISTSHTVAMVNCRCVHWVISICSLDQDWATHYC